jgi:hypothetical protein
MLHSHDERTTRFLAFQTKERELRALFITLWQHFDRRRRLPEDARGYALPRGRLTGLVQDDRFTLRQVGRL